MSTIRWAMAVLLASCPSAALAQAPEDAIADEDVEVDEAAPIDEELDAFPTSRP